jgi:hypothetical protein
MLSQSFCLTTVSIAVLACSPRATEQSLARGNYIGLEYPPLPSEFVSLGGAVLDPDSSSETSSGYLVSHMADSTGEMLWLQRMTKRDANGVPHWQVLAVEYLPDREEGTEIMYGNCRVGDASAGGDRYTYALVRWSEEEIITDVLRAWQIDTTAGRILPLSPDGVECVNAGGGV